MPLVPLLFTMAEGQERLDGSHGSVSLAEELASSLRLCRSVGGRLKQYFVHGRFEDCSRLEDCLRMSSRNDDGDDVTVEKARCLELWTKFEGISAFKVNLELWYSHEITHDAHDLRCRSERSLSPQFVTVRLVPFGLSELLASKMGIRSYRQTSRLECNGGAGSSSLINAINATWYLLSICFTLVMTRALNSFFFAATGQKSVSDGMKRQNGWMGPPPTSLQHFDLRCNPASEKPLEFRDCLTNDHDRPDHPNLWSVTWLTWSGFVAFMGLSWAARQPLVLVTRYSAKRVNRTVS